MKQTAIEGCHIFQYQNNTYSINVERMTCSIHSLQNTELLEAAENPSLPTPTPSCKEAFSKAVSGIGQTLDKSRSANTESYPIVNLILFLTQSCNLKCTYCYGDGGQYGAGGNMDETTALRAVDWLIEQSGKIKAIYIGFFGGEPFLQFPLMRKIVSYAKEKAAAAKKVMGFHATSNATLFDDEIIDFIKEHNILISVSLDGPQEIHDAQRPYANGEGSYASLLPKIKKLLKVMPQTLGHAVLVGDTSTQIVREELQTIGFTEFTMTQASQSLFVNQEKNTKTLRDTAYIIRDLEQEAERWLEYVSKRDVSSLRKVKKISRLYNALLLLLHNRKRRHACGAGWGMIAVSVTGDVYLCHRFVGQNEYKVGSIFEGKLNRETYQQNLRAGSVCADCFARYYCAGGCMYDNVVAHGSIFTPAEDVCCVKRKELELAAYIICNLTEEDQSYLMNQEIVPPKPCPFDF